MEQSRCNGLSLLATYEKRRGRSRTAYRLFPVNGPRVKGAFTRFHQIQSKVNQADMFQACPFCESEDPLHDYPKQPTILVCTLMCGYGLVVCWMQMLMFLDWWKWKTVVSKGRFYSHNFILGCFNNLHALILKKHIVFSYCLALQHYIPPLCFCSCLFKPSRIPSLLWLVSSHTPEPAPLIVCVCGVGLELFFNIEVQFTRLYVMSFRFKLQLST